ncbi:MAG: hypothetical protein HMLKMBBP_02092 [Planctomycetes bacterium]|nr:hypothetical protein [Planctomycetota bacterium]
MTIRSLAGTLGALLLAAAASQGCAVVPDAKAGASARVKAASVSLGEGKQTMVVATSKRDGGIFFTRPPYDLNGSWSARVSAGIFDPRDVEQSAGAFFTLEVDRREASGNQPTEYYGISARRFLPPDPDVLQVYSYTHAGVVQQTTFPGASAVHLEIAVDQMGDVVFTATDLATEDSESLGSVDLASPASPHQAGFGMFGAPKGARIGFTDFRLNSPGAPAVPIGAGHEACNLVMESALAALAAAYAVDDPVLDEGDVGDALMWLDEAVDAMTAARNAIAASLAAAKKSPEQKALGLAEKALADLVKSSAAFEDDGGAYAKKFVSLVVKQQYGRALEILDLLLPDELRSFLPGTGI